MRTFDKIYIEITNKCNLHCRFCQNNNRLKQELTLEQFENILSSIQGKTKLVYFHVKGEPLLHPYVEEFLNLCHKYEVMVNLTTNGTLIKNNIHKLINKPALRQINISLHSIEQNNDRINVSEYLDGVFSLIREIKEYGKPIVSLRLWNNKAGVDPLLNQSVYRALSEHFNVPTLEELVLTERSIQLSDRVYLNQDREFVWPKDGASRTEHGFCHGLRNQIAILVDGTIVPCCLDSEGEMNLGNIFHETLEEVLLRPRAVAIYEGFSARKAIEPLCQKCSFRFRFDRKKSSV